MSTVLQRFWAMACIFVGCLGQPVAARGDEPTAGDLAAEVVAEAQGNLSKLPFSTLGGMQYWNDERVLGGWRIQRNVLTGHHRLLDDADQRQAWGDLESCRKRLDGALAAGDVTAPSGEVVVVLHGLGSGRWAMRSLVSHLRTAGFKVVDVGYSTTSGRVADHAATLAQVIDGLPQAERLHFVAHSLGNLVVRHYLADQVNASPTKELDPRIGRMVMLAPPNQGSARASFWSDSKLFINTLGPAVKELGPGWKELEPKLATPPGEFGIIAGGLGNQHGFNLTIDGDDDGTLAVEETRLEGANELTVVPCTHSLLVFRDDVMDLTTHFLRHGRFQEE